MWRQRNARVGGWTWLAGYRTLIVGWSLVDHVVSRSFEIGAASRGVNLSVLLGSFLGMTSTLRFCFEIDATFPVQRLVLKVRTERFMATASFQDKCWCFYS